MKNNMKKSVYLCLSVLVLTMAGLSSCSNEGGGGNGVIWDIAPIEFSVFITDSQGHDLLDSATQNNLIKDITVVYEGKTYPVENVSDYELRRKGGAKTRAYFAHFKGLLLGKYWSHKTFTSGDYELRFGEFDGTESIGLREITLNLPNGIQANLAYRNNFSWKSNGNPDRNMQFYLNGQELNDEAGKCGYYNFQYSDTEGLKYVPSEIK